MNITLDGGALGETELRLLCNFVTIRGNACLANYQANAGGNVPRGRGRLRRGRKPSTRSLAGSTTPSAKPLKFPRL
jgi:hypothetical protein